MNKSDYEERIDAVCRLLESRLAEDISLDEAAQAAHLSPFHFHRLFRGLTGETLGGYVRRLRMEIAAHRLTQSEQDILSIALDVGYGSHEAFSRAFQKHFGINPSIFRKEKRVMTTTTEHTFEPIDVRIERREPCTVAAVRHVGPYNEVGEAWSTLMKWGWTKMMFGKPETFGLSYDDPEVTPSDRIRYDACMVVSPNTKVKGKIQLMQIPGGTFAVVSHDGPYEGFSQTYGRLFARIARDAIDGKHYRLGDPPSIEKYFNDPNKTKPEDLKSEIWMPVVEAKGGRRISVVANNLA